MVPENQNANPFFADSSTGTNILDVGAKHVALELDVGTFDNKLMGLNKTISFIISLDFKECNV